MSDSEIIAPAAIARLHEWGGDKLVGQMIRLFLENSPARMAQIRSGLTDRDLNVAEMGSHSLKSSAANLGAEKVRLLCADIEAGTVAGTFEVLEAALPALEDAFAAACTALAEIEKGMN